MDGVISVVEDVWGPSFDELTRRLDVRHEPDAWHDRDRLVELAASSAALVVRNRTQVDAALLDAAPDLRVIARAGVGLDNIDVAAADERGVVVVAALGANAASVAEHTLALALAVARHVVTHDDEVRRGVWERRAGTELAGRTWGLLSFGATARATARLAHALGMQVVAHDPFVDESDPAVAESGVELSSLIQVVAAADVLSVHLPATPETRGLVDADVLAHAKPGAILVNCGRGEVLDEEALADALESGLLAGAGLDVRQQEPPVADHRLHGFDNVVLTPHVAGITVEAQDRILRSLAEDLMALAAGHEARCAVGHHSAPSSRPTRTA